VHQTRSAGLPESANWSSLPAWHMNTSTPRYTQGVKLLFDFFKRLLL
jgi:hypothetical protein